MTQPKVIKVNPTARKLTNGQAAEIRTKHKEGQSKASLSRQYGLSVPCVNCIVWGDTYKDA